MKFAYATAGRITGGSDLRGFGAALNRIPGPRVYDHEVGPTLVVVYTTTNTQGKTEALIKDLMTAHKIEYLGMSPMPTASSNHNGDDPDDEEDDEDDSEDEHPCEEWLRQRDAAARQFLGDKG